MRSRKILHEQRIVETMIRLYCRKKHHADLCPRCRSLLVYVTERLEACPFGADKPFCSRCRVHCYREPDRSEIRRVMRFAGPRMLWHHPVVLLRHLIGG